MLVTSMYHGTLLYFISAKGEDMDSLENKIEKTRAALANLRNFTSWDWGAYKVEKHEKDVIIEALERQLSYLETLKNKEGAAQ